MVGRRVFDVSIESRRVLDVDIVALGNGTAFTAITREVLAVPVSDGFLTIRFMDNVPMIDFPKISAIEVNAIAGGIPTSAPVAPSASPPTTPFRPILINCGAGAYLDEADRSWIADDYFTGGNVYNTGVDISGTVDDEIYNSNRWGAMVYNVPVPNGLYEVTLHLSET